MEFGVKLKFLLSVMGSQSQLSKAEKKDKYLSF